MLKDLTLPLWGVSRFYSCECPAGFMIHYRSSVLGSLWSFLNPLAMILVYTVIFSQIMQAKLPGVEERMAYSLSLRSHLGLHSKFCPVA